MKDGKVHKGRYPLSYEYDAQSGIMTVEGARFGWAFFQAVAGNTTTGNQFEIVRDESGVVYIKRITA
jgi:hypothetical protein